MKIKVTSDKVTRWDERPREPHLHPSRIACSAFSLVEILVVVGLLALIVLALMTVFSSTQNAFRASVTQTDVLEGGRNTMDLIASDMKEMRASGGVSNLATGALNFYVGTFGQMLQPLPASSDSRTDVVQAVFFLTRDNLNGRDSWIGTGYAVDTNLNNNSIYPLYRFSANANVQSGNPYLLASNFLNVVTTGAWTNPAVSHLIDGVVDFRVRAFDTNGVWIGGGRSIANTWTSTPVAGEVAVKMFSNALPAAVEVELGVLEDRALRRAESLPIASQQLGYLSNHVAQVHIFRERVMIPNVDPSAY